VLNPHQEPTRAGTRVCPSVEGATNWFSTAFDYSTGLYYVQALEKCSIYTKSPAQWQPGQSYYAGFTRQTPDEPAQKVLRALDIRTGAIAWELHQTGPANSWGGLLATSGGVVFVAEDGGALMAVSTSEGEPLWQFQANIVWKASPMTYMFDGTQYVAIAAGPSIISFALVADGHRRD
jgi:alcohol dehydrogenase (cytochrome c)